MAQRSTDQQIQAAVQAQAAVNGQATRQAVTIAQTAARGFTGWYDMAAITAWAAALATQIEALQRLVARTTDAYLARSLSTMTGRRIRPAGIVDVTDLRGPNLTHAGAYARAADVYRWQQSQFDAVGRAIARGQQPPAVPTIIDPVNAAVNRVAAVARADTQLAMRAQSQAVLTDHADRGLVTGYRRIVHPELSKGGSCGLCIASSDRLYYVAELLPIHDHCECTVLPVTEHNDPGQRLNNADLGRLYEHGQRADALKRTRYQIDEHGELGLVLNPAGAKVRGPRQVAADESKIRRSRTDAERAAIVRQIRDELAQAQPKVQQLAADAPTTWGDYLTKLEDRISDLDHQLAA